MEPNIPQVPRDDEESSFRPTPPPIRPATHPIRPVTPPSYGTPQQTIIIRHEEQKTNGVGTAGFVLATISLILCWIPVVNVILWILGVILSAVGMAKKPKGLAIAGLCISFVDLIISIIFFGIFAAVLAAS